MLSLELVTEFVFEYFLNVSISKNGTHFLTRCTLCGDSKKSLSKKRFNLSYNNGNPIYHCWNCSESGSFLQLYSKLKCIEIEDAKKELFGFDPERLIQRLSNKKRTKVLKEIEYENHNWILNDCVTRFSTLIDSPDGGLMYSKYVEVVDIFSKNRKLSRDIKLFFAYKGDYKGRIIIPIYDEYNDITYFQARRIPGSDMQPKYKNPTLAKGNIIFNEHKFKSDKDIIVVEGLIDAMTIGDQGTAMLGSSLSDDFLSKLFKLTDLCVIVAFDNDEPGYISLEKFMKESKYSKKVFYFLMPNDSKDINSYMVDYGIDNMDNFISENTYSYMRTYLFCRLNNIGNT